MYVLPVRMHLLIGYLFILQSAMFSYGGTNVCPKLQFLSDHGCQPCSLCDPASAKRKNILKNECRRANPNPLPDGRVLWCDVVDGPFPECPPIQQSVLQSPCSNSCSANFRTFAPGCMCTVGCDGQPTQVVLCTNEFQWNNTDVLSQCAQPSPSTATPEDIETRVPKHNKNAEERRDMVLPIVLGSLVSVILLVVAVIIIGTCLYQRLRSQPCPSPRSGASTSPLLEGSKAGSHSSSSEERIQMSCGGQETGQNGAVHDGRLKEEMTAVPMDCDEAKELGSVAVQNPYTERNKMQQRGVDKDQKENVQALKALMDSLEVLRELSKRFDQEYAYDRITWHDVAVDLLGWDHNDVHHIDYRCRQPGSSPGDGPMYQVLERARQEGRGLLDLIDCLRGQRKKQGAQRSKDTEEILIEFWQKWKSKQAAGGLC